MSRPINLDINNSGSWKRVASFDLDELGILGDLDLQTAVDRLFSMSKNEKIGARLIMPGDTAPLVTWTKSEGWVQWRTARSGVSGA